MCSIAIPRIGLKRLSAKTVLRENLKEEDMTE